MALKRTSVIYELHLLTHIHRYEHVQHERTQEEYLGHFRDSTGIDTPPKKMHPFIGEENKQKDIFLAFSGIDVSWQANMLAATEGDPLVNIHINVSHIQ